MGAHESPQAAGKTVSLSMFPKPRALGAMANGEEVLWEDGPSSRKDLTSPENAPGALLNEWVKRALQDSSTRGIAGLRPGKRSLKIGARQPLDRDQEGPVSAIACAKAGAPSVSTP